jgi:hypothetical protein
MKDGNILKIFYLSFLLLFMSALSFFTGYKSLFIYPLLLNVIFLVLGIFFRFPGKIVFRMGFLILSQFGVALFIVAESLKEDCGRAQIIALVLIFVGLFNQGKIKKDDLKQETLPVD